MRSTFALDLISKPTQRYSQKKRLTISGKSNSEYCGKCSTKLASTWMIGIGELHAQNEYLYILLKFHTLQRSKIITHTFS